MGVIRLTRRRSRKPPMQRSILWLALSLCLCGKRFTLRICKACGNLVFLVKLFMQNILVWPPLAFLGVLSPTCLPPVVALLGSGSCLGLVPPFNYPSAPTCLGTPYAPPIPGHGTRPVIFQELRNFILGIGCWDWSYHIRFARRLESNGFVLFQELIWLDFDL